MNIYLIALAIVLLAIIYLLLNYFSIKKMDEGTDEMVEMSAIIREGASTFLKTEFKVIFIVLLVMAIIFSLL